MLEIVKYPHPVLREEAEPIDTIDDEVKQLIDDMSDAMYLDEGVGLAANQVGVAKRLLIMDAGDGFKVFINPEIVEKGDEEEAMEEGCLSLPDIRVTISRPKEIVVRAQDETGEVFEARAEGLHARVFQHEIDHLNGVLIIDHASTVQRSLIKSKLRKLEKEFA